MNCEAWPGAVKLEAAPPPGPVTACRSMLCGIFESGWFFRWNSTVSPWRTRMKLPGTVPPNVQNVYFTPSEISFSTSRTSSSTMTFAGVERPVAGGTIGGLVNMALMGSPCGGPKSPAAEPPVSVLADGDAPVSPCFSDLQPGNPNSAAVMISGMTTCFIKPPLMNSVSPHYAFNSIAALIWIILPELYLANYLKEPGSCYI